MRRGNFAGLPTIYDPLDPGRAAFPGNVIPLNRFHPTSVDLLEFYPAPNVAGTVFNYQNQQKRVIDKDQFIQRIDVRWLQFQWFGRTVMATVASANTMAQCAS
jgi:hypothetical protein